MAFSYKNYNESDAVKKRRAEAEKYQTYKESQSVSDAKAAMDAHEKNKVSPWTGGSYGEALNGAIDKINNREKFSYDLNGDALYQQYKNQYINGGRLAMQDTLGQAAALTGGYGNSYAVTAGNQAYQEYLKGLNDVVPELYQMAYDRYNNEGEELYNQASLYNTMYNTEYGEYRDKVSDWNTEADRLSNKYYNESNLDYSRFSDNRDYYTTQYNNERNYDYGQYTDAYNRAFAKYQQGVSESQYAQNLALSKASSSGSSKGIDPLSSKELYEVQTNCDSLMESGGIQAVASYLNNLVNRGYMNEDEASDIYEKYNSVKTSNKDGSTKIIPVPKTNMLNVLN